MERRALVHLSKENRCQEWPATPRENAGSSIGFTLLLLIAATLFLTGCASDGGKRTKVAPPVATSDDGITELNLLAIPIALNFDQFPGPDGFVVKIFAGNKNRPKPLLIERGTLEILMYDGILPATPQPSRRAWTFPGNALRQYQLVTSIGSGYQFSLRWGDAKPQKDRISIVARYTTPEGLTVHSAPSVIAVTGK